MDAESELTHSLALLDSIQQKVDARIVEVAVESIMYGKGIRITYDGSDYEVEATYDVPFNEILAVTKSG